SFTAAETGLVSIKMSPTVANSSIFVYSSCVTASPPAPAVPPTSTIACLAGVGNSNATTRVIPNLAVTAGTTYTIVISSATGTQTVGYTMIIQKEACAGPVGSVPLGTDITITTAKLKWTNPTNATEWRVAIQPVNSGVPSVE